MREWCSTCGESEAGRCGHDSREDGRAARGRSSSWRRSSHPDWGAPGPEVLLPLWPAGPVTMATVIIYNNMYCIYVINIGAGKAPVTMVTVIMHCYYSGVWLGASVAMVTIMLNLCNYYCSGLGEPVTMATYIWFPLHYDKWLMYTWQIVMNHGCCPITVVEMDVVQVVRANIIQGETDHLLANIDLCGRFGTFTTSVFN